MLGNSARKAESGHILKQSRGALPLSGVFRAFMPAWAKADIPKILNNPPSQNPYSRVLFRDLHLSRLKR